MNKKRKRNSRHVAKRFVAWMLSAVLLFGIVENNFTVISYAAENSECLENQELQKFLGGLDQDLVDTKLLSDLSDTSNNIHSPEEHISTETESTEIPDDSINADQDNADLDSENENESDVPENISDEITDITEDSEDADSPEEASDNGEIEVTEETEVAYEVSVADAVDKVINPVKTYPIRWDRDTYMYVSVSTDKPQKGSIITITVPDDGKNIMDISYMEWSSDWNEVIGRANLENGITAKGNNTWEIIVGNDIESYVEGSIDWSYAGGYAGGGCDFCWEADGRMYDGEPYNGDRKLINPEVLAGEINESYGNITWSIDTNGKLIISGTGDWSEPGRETVENDYINTPDYSINTKTPWLKYNKIIKSAEVTLNGTKDFSFMFYMCPKLETVTFKDMDGSSATDMSYMFATGGETHLNNIDLSCFNNNKVTSFERLFDMDWNLTNLTLPDNFVTSHATNLNSMFWGTELKSLDVSGFNTENVTDMGAMFSYMTQLESLDLSTFNTNKVENMFALFLCTDSLKSLTLGPNFNTSLVPNMEMMFSWTGLEEIDLTKCNFSTASLKKARYMFSENANLKKVILPNGFFTSQMEDLEEMFSRNPMLEEIVFGNNIDTSNVKVLKGMFVECPSLTRFELPAGFNIGDEADATEMFSDCINLIILDLSKITVSETANTTDMFKGCDKLTGIIRNDVSTEDIESIDDVPDVLWVTAIPKSVDYTGSAITFPNMKVFWGKTLLKQGTDYTVKYSNNVKAGDSEDTASVTITGKGNYTGSIVKRFSINKLELGKSGGENSPLLTAEDITLLFNSKVQKGTTYVNYKIGDKYVALKSGTDFEYVYEESQGDWKSAKEEAYIVKIVGIGNYTGEATFKESIVDSTDKKTISSLRIKVSSTPATGEPVEPKVTVKDGDYELNNPEDYTIAACNNILPGKATVVIKANPNSDKYVGNKVLTFNITGIPIKNVVISGIEDKTYDGTEQKQSTINLKYNGSDLAANEYSITYEKNVAVGKKATVIVTGKGRFTGTVKKTFKINPKTIKDDDVTMSTAFSYTKGGVKPLPTVKDGKKVLVLGVDYTLKYTNNKSVYDYKNPNKTKSTVIITCKGNYRGIIRREFHISKGSLKNDADIQLTDVKFEDKSGICKTAVKLVTKKTGVTLKAGTDYEKNFTYSYADRATIQRKKEDGTRENVSVEANTKVDMQKDIIPVGTRIKVTVQGKGNYWNEPLYSKTGYFYFTQDNLNSASIKIATQYYAGRPVLLDKEDIEIVLDNKVLSKSDYKILSYTNNNKKGTAKVTLQGVGNYGGRKTVSFTIAARSIKTTIVFNNSNSYMGDVDGDAAPATGTMKALQIDKVAQLTKNSYTRSGYRFKGWSLAPGGEVKFDDNAEINPQDSILFPTGTVTSYGNILTLYAVWEKN